MGRESAARLPEDEALVAIFRRRLTPHHSRLRDVVQRFEQRWKRRGVETLHGVGIPLRPLFIPRRRLEQIATGFHRALTGLQQQFLAFARRPQALARRVPIPQAIYEHLDFERSVKSDLFLSHFRPDGFLYEDRFVLSEINYGNGVIVSLGYTEVLADLFANHPLFDGNPFRAEAIERPFVHWLDVVDRQVGFKRPAHVVLLAHSREWGTVLEFGPRVRHQVEQTVKRLEARGLTVTIAHETDVFVRRGRAYVKGSKREVDAFVVVTISTSFFDDPHEFEGSAKLFRGTRVGRAPVLKPFAGLAVDKGTLPWMLDLGLFPVRMDDGFEVDAADTRYLVGTKADWAVRDRRDLVLKRAFDGKDTHVGIATKPKVWAEAVQRATESADSVVQAYSPLPRAQMPVLIDGRHVEWIDVRVELTPFIVRGQFAGALARYAPDAPGLVLSPPPDGMGMTLVYPC
jgi:hypothetical protein